MKKSFLILAVLIGTLFAGGFKANANPHRDFNHRKVMVIRPYGHPHRKTIIIKPCVRPMRREVVVVGRPGYRERVIIRRPGRFHRGC